MNYLKIYPVTKYAENFPTISVSSKFIPDWYKKSFQKINGLEKFDLIPDQPFTTTSTYKKCSPFLDALTNGYMVTITQDIEVVIKNDGSPFLMWRTERQPITWHTKEQWDGLFIGQDYHDIVYKWNNEFSLETPKQYSILFNNPSNRLDLPFFTLSGIVDTDTYKNPVQFPFLLKKNFTGIIPAGTPVAQINFIKRDDWKIKYYKYNQDKTFIEKEKFLSTIVRSYKNNHWKRKKYQ